MPRSVPVHLRVGEEQFEQLESLAKALGVSSPHKAAQQLVVTSLTQGSDRVSQDDELLAIQAEIQHLSLAVSALTETNNQLVFFISELSVLFLSQAGVDTESAATTIAHLLEIAFGETE